MGVASLTKARGQTVMGIDASTKSLAFCVFHNRRPVHWGKVNFTGVDVFARMRDASRKMDELSSLFEVDYIVFESAILAKVSNADTTIKLAMMYGVIISKLMNNGTRVTTCPPLTWQSYIGNPNFTPKEKAALKKEHPGHDTRWYSAEIRNRRKKRTMDCFNAKWPHLNLDDDDVSDAFGLAYYGYHELTSRR